MFALRESGKHTHFQGKTKFEKAPHKEVSSNVLRENVRVNEVGFSFLVYTNNGVWNRLNTSYANNCVN